MELSEDSLAGMKDQLRGMVVERLEAIWQACRPHVDGTLLEEGGRVDPRMVKIGLDTTDRLTRLARLEEREPVVAEEQVSVEAADRAAVVESLLALEARIKAGPAA
jgi:hypothetical protein